MKREIELAELKLWQLISVLGDGHLSDGSVCSSEFRKTLRTLPSQRLRSYVAECLDTGAKELGLPLQDIVNELGARLSYDVEFGLYKGKQGMIGADGVWRNDERAVVVETKTTTAYAISIETVIGYRDKLITEKRISSDSTCLYIVGRDDTSGLEEQVRGSRHAWDVRIIGVEALLRLVDIKEESSSEAITQRIHELLRPLEFTRLDSIVNLVFETVEDRSGDDIDNPDEFQKMSVHVDPSKPHVVSGECKRTISSDRKLLQLAREAVVANFTEDKNLSLTKESKILYRDSEKHVGISVAISKNYGGKRPYWFAFKAPQRLFLSRQDDAYALFGFQDRSDYISLPFKVIENLCAQMLSSPGEGDPTHWHVYISFIDEKPQLILKAGDHVDLSQYLVGFGK
jgi:hypothetical protein